MGTESDHGSTRPDMNWHHSTGYGGDRDNAGGYPGGDDRYPTRNPGGRPGMYGGSDYGKFFELTQNKNWTVKLLSSIINSKNR